MDPLAVLMSKVWTTKVSQQTVEDAASQVMSGAMALDGREISLPWIDNDQETKHFIKYWFGEKQRRALRRLSYALSGPAADRYQQDVVDVLKVALSRIIVSKEQRASLARDTSHSRPHKVAERSDFDVYRAFDRSVREVVSRLTASPPTGKASIRVGDARHLAQVRTASIDAVLTSPPYLNAIDYMRGHRLSLVWLGFSIDDLRTIRSDSVGAERSPSKGYDPKSFEDIKQAMGAVELLPKRFERIVDRYAEDISRVMNEVARVLKPGCHATFVVGDSCLRSVFIRNSAAVAMAAKRAGLTETRRLQRDLPSASRYLPLTDAGSLGKRMRTETILTFIR